MPPSYSEQSSPSGGPSTPPNPNRTLRLSLSLSLSLSLILTLTRPVYTAAAARAQGAAFRATAEALVQRVDLLAAEGGVADEEPLPPLPLPPPLEVGGAVGPSDAADFVTGSVVLNRMHRAVNQVPLPLPAYPTPTPNPYSYRYRYRDP